MAQRHGLYGRKKNRNWIFHREFHRQKDGEMMTTKTGDVAMPGKIREMKM